jgi:hypothetical protein
MSGLYLWVLLGSGLFGCFVRLSLGSRPAIAHAQTRGQGSSERDSATLFVVFQATSPLLGIYHCSIAKLDATDEPRQYGSRPLSRHCSCSRIYRLPATRMGAPWSGQTTQMLIRSRTDRMPSRRNTLHIVESTCCMRSPGAIID